MSHSIKVISISLIAMMFSYSAFANNMHQEMHNSMHNDMHNSMMEKNCTETNAQVYQSSGVVKAIDNQQHKVSISHGAIPALKWPAMTMNFISTPVTDKLATLDSGATVDFSFIQQGNDYVLQSINAK